MKARLTANSENLRKTFPEIYQDLFSKSSVVASAPGAFWWTGEHGVLEGNLAILQKIPRRVYVGIEPTSGGEVKIGSFLTFSSMDKKFISSFIEEPVATKLLTYLKEWPEIKMGGIILHILSEIPYGRGMNSSGAFAVALATALHIFWKKLDPEEIKKWRYLPTNKLLKKQSFHHLLNASWKLESIFHGDLTSGATVISPMIGGDYPTICFPPHQDIDHAQDHWLTHYKHLDNKKITAARLNEFFKFKSLPSWSFDYGLIYSGESRSTSAIVQTAITRRRELFDVLKNASQLNLPKPYSMPNTHSWSSYMDALKINSLEILLNFKEVFEKGLSEKVMHDFFISINRYQDLLNVVTFHSAAIESIENHLRQIVFDYGNEYGIGIKTTGGGLKGNILFVTAYQGIRDSVNGILDMLSKRLNLKFTLDYASWLDGIEDNPITVEQDLASKIYSQYVSEGSIFVRHFSSTGFNHTDIYTPEHFARQKGAMSLILDPTEHEIWIRKQKLDSRSIHSASATIQVLKTLLDNLGREVKNTRLPKSSYAADRNELQSKIISPLNKVLKHQLKKELPVEIHGSLDDFSVKLAELPFSVHYIEKIF